MKKAIVTSAVIMALGIIVAACAQPEGAGRQADNPTGPTVSAPRVTTDEERLEEMQRSTHVLINQYQMIGTEPVPEYLFDIARAVEKANQALRELEGQRWATQTLINEYATAGQAVPQFEYEVLESIEQARHEILTGIGLAD